MVKKNWRNTIFSLWNMPRVPKQKLFPENLGIRCRDFFVKKKFRPFFGCAPSARTWGTPHSGQKSISLAAVYKSFLKAWYIFYNIFEKFSPSWFSSTTDFLLAYTNCSNGSGPNLEYIRLNLALIYYIKFNHMYSKFGPLPFEQFLYVSKKSVVLENQLGLNFSNMLWKIYHAFRKLF